MSVEFHAIRCRDRCGRSVADDAAALQAGWSSLSIAGGWRCGACTSTLAAAGRIVGADLQTEDGLPPDSRGALPKETASTILPPAKGIA